MNKYNDEQGMALVLTLAFIVIIMLFSLALIFQVTNTSKQVSTMEKNIEARHMAEMGVDYYSQFIRSKKDSLETFNKTDLKSKIYVLSKKFDDPINIENDKRNFEIRIDDIFSSEEDKWIIPFTSTGTAFGKTATIDSELIIDFSGN